MTANNSEMRPGVGTERPPQRQGLAKDVVRYLHDMIAMGELKPGERIDQAAVAEALGVSKLPVREALIALEAEGFIDLKPRRGAFVSALTPEDILDHYVIFGRVAGLAAERAAVEMTEDALSELTQLTEAMSQTTDPIELSQFNDRFHQRINRAGGSTRLKHVLRTLSEAMPHAFFAFAGGREENKCAVEEHKRIVSLLMARDAPAAGKAMAEHFESRGREAQRALAARGFWS